MLNSIQVDSCLVEVSRCIHVLSSIFFSNSIIITYLESVYGLHGLHDLEQPNSWDVARGKPMHWLLDLEHWHGCLKDGGQAARAPMPGSDHLRRLRDHRHGQEVQTAPSFQGAAVERMGDKDMEKSPAPNDEGAGIYLDFSGRVHLLVKYFIEPVTGECFT